MIPPMIARRRRRPVVVNTRQAAGATRLRSGRSLRLRAYWSNTERDMPAKATMVSGDRLFSELLTTHPYRSWFWAMLQLSTRAVLFVADAEIAHSR